VAIGPWAQVARVLLMEAGRQVPSSRRSSSSDESSGAGVAIIVVLVVAFPVMVYVNLGPQGNMTVGFIGALGCIVTFPFLVLMLLIAFGVGSAWLVNALRSSSLARFTTAAIIALGLAWHYIPLPKASPISTAHSTPVPASVATTPPEPTGTARWPDVEVFGYKAGESVDDTMAHSSSLGLTKVSDCAPPEPELNFKCNFIGSSGETLDVYFCRRQLRALDYDFPIRLYGSVLKRIEQKFGDPRVQSDPNFPMPLKSDPNYDSLVWSLDWGSVAEKNFSISIGNSVHNLGWVNVNFYPLT